ncbi:MAG: exodeoxyribonuclease VII large subunit [Atribacterota bacterium]|nr:exodeoxyribonuclease VII large subunit [Atribacterota bacterium]MDD4896281.1 exodeoxyribonuclease VII large subunit [Atribacterota bacterium]
MLINSINEKIFTVSSITHHIQMLFNSDPLLHNITIIGEISNFKYHSSGHMYFVLKDDQSQIKCVMFRGNNQGLDFEPGDGISVKAKGEVRVYERRGEYQFYVSQMTEAGKGALFAAFEALKEKLKAEGLFRPEIKKTLPKIPRKIAVITSPTGAAIKDIISITLRRFTNMHIIIVPAQVQGDEAARQIAENIDFLNQELPELDFIIIGRGGGSIEELWAFNEERLARAIYASQIPIVSAVGHETDFTISDFVADLRAPTPSGAAEMTIPDKESLVQHLRLMQGKLNRIIWHIMELKEQRYLNTVENLKYQSPKNQILQHLQTIDDLHNRLKLNMKHIVNINENILINYKEKIITLSPKSILSRGYSICLKIPERIVVKKINQVEKDNQIEVLIQDGKISANVFGKEEIKNE